MALRIGLLAVALMLPAGAAAETERGWRGELFAGGYLSLTGPADYGAQVLGVLSPGGALGRFGVRLSARSFESSTSNGFIAAGVTFEAASSRPGLALDLFVEGGAVSGAADAIAGAGIHTTLGLIGPLALSADVAGHLLFDGVDTRLALTTSLLLGVTIPPSN